jgi:TonB-linked SusC/RagA family outer membrane protein
MALCLIVCIGTAFAQTHKVSGTVTEAANGAPVPGATVMVEGTMTGTSTGVDGKFTINVPARGSIVVSAIGFTTVTIPVEGRNIIDVALEEDRNLLENAVVVGYGSAKKVGSLVGSVSTVNSETIKNAPSSSALDQLQGQVAGLSVLTTGGVAGDNNVSMTLHGVGSLGASSTPLFIIDGIPSSSRSIMAMNPNDIKTISILKDASATSIYGSRAANGVVFVTTKSGSYNEKATVTVRSQYGISTLADMTFYNNMMSGDELKEFWVRAGIYTPEYIYNTYTSKGYTCNTKWYEYFQNLNNPQYQNDITVEGGSQKVAYMVGGSQFHQRGNTIGNWYDRYTIRSNVQGHPTNWLKVGLNVNFSYDRRNNNGNWGDGSNAGGNNYLSGGLSMILNPLYPAIDPVTGSVYEKEFAVYAGAINPKYQDKNTRRQTDRYGLVGSTYVEIEPIKNLKIVSRAGVDGSETLFNYALLPSFATEFSRTPGRSKSSTFQYSATITNTIEYSHSFTDHKFSVLAGHEGIGNNYDYFWANSSNQTDDRLLELDHGTQATFNMTEEKTQSSFLSFFGHADYNYRERYFLDATIRYDASSRFGRHNRWAPFWAVGFLWKAKNEEFLRNVSFCFSLPNILTRLDKRKTSNNFLT